MFLKNYRHQKEDATPQEWDRNENNKEEKSFIVYTIILNHHV